MSRRGRAHIDVEHLDQDAAAVVVGDDPLGDVADELADRVGGLLADGTPHVVVEFAGGILNSKLLDALVRASAHQPAGTSGIAVVAPPRYVHQMLLVSEAGGPLLLADSREDALEALRES
jgi:hypothetical protein